MKCYRIITDHSDKRQIRSDLSSLNSSDHFMNFNIKKFKHLAITKRKTNVIIQSEWVAITDVTTEKDLGVHISSTLSWNDHIDFNHQ